MTSQGRPHRSGEFPPGPAPAPALRTRVRATDVPAKAETELEPLLDTEQKGREPEDRGRGHQSTRVNSSFPKLWRAEVVPCSVLASVSRGFTLRQVLAHHSTPNVNKAVTVDTLRSYSVLGSEVRT